MTNDERPQRRRRRLRLDHADDGLPPPGPARARRRVADNLGCTSDRDASGRFILGNKASIGNISNRREGAIRRAIVRCVTDTDFDEVVQRALEQAKRGSDRARRWIAERLDGLPAREQTFAVLPALELDDADGCARSTARVLAEVSAGNMSVEVGERVCALIDHHLRAIETALVSARLAALETIDAS